MNNYSFSHDNKTYNRVSKPKAFKEYQKGNSIVIAASNIRPFNDQGLGYIVLNRHNREAYVTDEEGILNDFENLLNSFSYYNCSSETGRYVSFYIENN